MKHLLVLLLLLTPFAATVAQDGICGNQSVYTVCGQDTRCIDGLCMYCVWFVTYDNPSCDYSVEGCVCMYAFNNVACNAKKAAVDSRAVLKRQQAKNRLLVKPVARV